MKNFKIIFLFTILLTYFSCSNNDDSGTPAQRTYADLQNDFQKIDFTTGINDVSLTSLSGNIYNFRVIIPNVDVASTRPLIVTLHGASGGDPDAYKSTACYAEPGFESLDAIILSPNGGNYLWNELYNQQMVLTLIDLVNTYLPVDISKIVVTGYSNGGNGAWFFAETQPNLFSAAIPIASSYNTYNTNNIPRKIDTPLYVIHGEDDELFPLEQTQTWVDATREAGTDATLEVAPGLTHNDPCEYVPYLKHAATWLSEEVW